MIKSTPHNRLWDDCLEFESYTQSNSIHCICKLDEEVPITLMSKKTSYMSQFCELEWFKWVISWDEIAPYLYITKWDSLPIPILHYVIWCFAILCHNIHLGHHTLLSMEKNSAGTQVQCLCHDRCIKCHEFNAMGLHSTELCLLHKCLASSINRDSLTRHIPYGLHATCNVTS